MVYPEYVWMVHNWYNVDWWKRNYSGCTVSEMRNMINMQIVIDHYPRINKEHKNITNIGGIVSTDFFIVIYTYNTAICR